MTTRPRLEASRPRRAKYLAPPQITKPADRCVRSMMAICDAAWLVRRETATNTNRSAENRCAAVRRPSGLCCGGEKVVMVNVMVFFGDCVNFWVFGFDIKFGSPPPLSKPASLARFWAVVIKAGTKGGALSFPANTPTANLLQQQQQPTASRHSRGSAHEEADSTAMSPIVLACEPGLEPQPGTGTQKTDKDTEWLVRSGTFSFLVTFQFAVNEAWPKEKRETEPKIRATQSRSARSRNSR